jgi:Holliday junction resolvase RusA-like endonuclease
MKTKRTMAEFILTREPPGVNACYANRKFRSETGTNFGRVKTAEYKAWIRGEMMTLLSQRVRPVPYPVSVSIALPSSSRLDCDAPFKAILDLLVRAGVIPKDSKRFVRKVSSEHSDGTETIVRVETISDKREPVRNGEG